MRCGEVAAMPRAFGWMGGWRSRREMEDEETAARAPPTDITIFHQLHHLTLNCHVILLSTL